VNILHSIDYFADAKAFLDALYGGGNYNLLWLDIPMGEAEHRAMRLWMQPRWHCP